MSDGFFTALLSSTFPMVEGPDDLAAVPAVLDRWNGEFCASLRTDTRMVAAACRAGYIPMGLEIAGREVLLIKSHFLRCVLDLADLHISASARRGARGLTFAVDRDFAGCLAATVAHHPDRWLTAELCAALTLLHDEPLFGVRMHSVEIYARDALVAGEIGMCCGAAYTSLSGFHRRSGAGSVQLAALGCMLEEHGFAFWDLGMEMDYKIRLGARLLPRQVFLAVFASARRREARLRVDAGDCEALLRARRPHPRNRGVT